MTPPQKIRYLPTQVNVLANLYVPGRRAPVSIPPTNVLIFNEPLAGAIKSEELFPPLELDQANWLPAYTISTSAGTVYPLGRLWKTSPNFARIMI